jgi:hypothetical protein
MAKILDWDRVCTKDLLQEELILRGSTVIIMSEFTKSGHDIECLCPVCGYTWEATPCNLVKGTRCARCVGRAIVPLEELQEELNAKDKNVVVFGPYRNSKEKFNAVCTLCNYQWMTTAGYLRCGTFYCQGCRAIEKQEKSKLGHLELIEDLRAMGKDFTLLSNFTNHKSHIDFMCNVCGYEDSKIPLHIRLHGCYNCSHLKKSDLESIQARLDSQGKQIKVSGEYVNSQTHLSCECQICKTEWDATPSNLKKRGCPGCAVTGFDPSKPGNLYYLRVEYEGETYWKVGITNLSIRERFPAKDRGKLTTLYCHLFDNGADALLAERNILKLYKEYRPKGVKILQTGNTELFTKDVLQMDHLFWGPI